MVSTVARVALVALTVALLVGYGLYRWNAPPVVPLLSALEAESSSKPFVVKFHAQWCAACMVTKSVWAQIEERYSGRVNLVVFDFTTDAASSASRDEAARLGLTNIFDEFAGATGMVVVVHGGRTRTVSGTLAGSRKFADYQAEIDRALAQPRR